MDFKPELLAPAGSLKVLKAAVNVGADAVYFGLNDFNARINANNFSETDLLEGMDYLKKRGKKGYVTLNTLVKDTQINDLINQIKIINSAQVDGVIVQDLGVLEIIKSVAKDIEIHGSTQMTVHNLDGVNLLYKKGVSRVVLSRELSLNDISFIKENTECELEVFCHGALCVCYSGACLMSSFIGERSGNRGACAGPCRMKYSYNNKEKYFLSLKDLETTSLVETFKEMKIDSLKIEGRLKSEYYVATVVDTYRRLIDGEKLSKQDLELLFQIFNRGGYTNGYLTEKKGSFMFAPNRDENPYSQFENIAKNKFKDILYKENKEIIKKQPIDIIGKFKIGENASISCFSSKVVSNGLVEKSQKSPVSKEKVIENLSKLADTSYFIRNIELDMDENIFIPIREINDLRRRLIEMLENEKTEKINPFNPYNFEFNGFRTKTNLEFILKVKSKEQFLWAISKNKKIIAPYDMVFNNHKLLADKKDMVFISLPIILFDKENASIKETLKSLKKLGFNNACVSNISHISLLSDFSLISLPPLNITNSNACEFHNFKITGISSEMNLKDISKFNPQKQLLAYGYGHIEMMVCENCLKSSICGQCHKEDLYLKDRKGEELILSCAFGCRNEILNPYPIVMSDKLDDMKNAGINYIILSFTIEGENECEKVLCDYENGINNSQKFTRGHFYRGAK